ncbi:sel1 repeat family protein [Marivibrio halodurans]|uniref:Sel1 repeat family protein n=1 Tax=Marivibrio halodurans TaxID=2039722 RepID=A0A8J7UZN0_9PROT|nr:sel1 repeat family protein [Marivibrio halodurans]MBP5855856.1 sel1 repeat family protein [Marivibrio halodurans]
MTRIFASMHVRMAYAAAALLFSTVLWSAPAVADPSIDAGPGVAAYEAGDYARAHDLLKPAAEAGDIQARYLMARLLSGDLADRTDYQQAFAYLDAKTRCFSVDALNFYANAMLRYHGEERYTILVEEIEIYKEAAGAGSIKALFNMGLTITKNMRKPVLGASYVYEAAEKGDPQGSQIIKRIKADHSGDIALARIRKLVREQPFEVRWPALTSFRRQCPAF